MNSPKIRWFQAPPAQPAQPTEPTDSQVQTEQANDQRSGFEVVQKWSVTRFKDGPYRDMEDKLVEFGEITLC